MKWGITDMFTERNRKLIGFLLALVILGVVACVIVYHFFFSMNNLPSGELILSSESPNGKYTINLYLVNGGATTDYAVRGELCYGQKTKNIYWQYHEHRSNINWIGEYEVEINGVILDVRSDVYDWRRN